MAVPMCEERQTKKDDGRGAAERPLNILVIHEILPRPDRHGADGQWMQILRELRAQGHLVVPVARNGGDHQVVPARCAGYLLVSLFFGFVAHLGSGVRSSVHGIIASGYCAIRSVHLTGALFGISLQRFLPSSDWNCSTRLASTL
jgi:hypothetical protein